MSDREAVTSILVTPATRTQLKALGKKGETYDDIIKALLKSQKKN